MSFGFAVGDFFYNRQVVSPSDRDKLSDYTSHGEKLLRVFDLFVMCGCTEMIISQQDLSPQLLLDPRGETSTSIPACEIYSQLKP
jgi:hypothetical protein